MVTGRPPFEGNTPLQILMRMAQEQAPAADLVNTSVPAEVSALIKKMMAPEFRDRYQDMESIIKELDRIENVSSGAAAPALQYPKAEALPEGVPGKPVPVRRKAPKRARPKKARQPAKKGSGLRRGVKVEPREGGKEGRTRAAPQKPSSSMPLLLFLGFLAVAAAVILVLVMKLKEKDTKKDRPSADAPAAEAPATVTERPAAAPGAQPGAPAEGTAPAPETPPGPKPKEKPAGEHGRSLFGPGGVHFEGGGG
jgi:hypothetical protein